jgi:hypothetical protein
LERGGRSIGGKVSLVADERHRSFEALPPDRLDRAQAAKGRTDNDDLIQFRHARSLLVH